MMSFKYEEIEISVLLDSNKKESITSPSHVWYRESGDCVIVVIDDLWHYCKQPPELILPPDTILPLLKKAVCLLPDIRAIGYFPLAGDKAGVHTVMERIEEWLNKIKTSETRIYFLVDIQSAMGDEASCLLTKKWLKKNGYPPEQTRFLSRGGTYTITLKDTDFSKLDEYNHIRSDTGISPKLKEFLGIKLHKDEIISEAIKFYIQAWEASWTVKGWDHNKLETQGSVHLEALADWLGDSINVSDLYNWLEGESAKSLVIWLGGDPLWDTRRRIQGKVLKAAMENLEIPLSKTNAIPAEPIKMPCTPCLPFLISLRSFLLCAGEQGAPVSEVEFFQNEGHCRFRLILEQDLRDPEGLKSRYYEVSKCAKPLPRRHPLARSLVELTYCITDGLEDMGRDYMRLFTEGTETPVVEVKEIAKGYIDLIR